MMPCFCSLVREPILHHFRQYPLHLQIPLPLRIEDHLQQLPLLSGFDFRGAALKRADESFPLGLLRKVGKTVHIPFPVKVVDSIDNHKHPVAKTIDLHGQYAYLVLTRNDLRPDIGVDLNVLIDYFLIVRNSQSLTIPLHGDFG